MEDRNKKFMELVKKLRASPKGIFEGMSAVEIVHFIRNHQDIE